MKLNLLFYFLFLTPFLSAQTFTEIAETPFEAVSIGSLVFSDVNGDGHQDVFITGSNDADEPVSKLYTNYGTGNFTEIIDTPFDGLWWSSVAFSDVNSDGREDLLIIGQKGRPGFENISKLYINEGVTSFTKELGIEFNLDFGIYPNPAKSNDLDVSYNSIENSSILLKVYDLNGDLIHQQKEFAGIGQQTFSIGISALVAGSYFIQLEDSKRKGIGQFIIE